MDSKVDTIFVELISLRSQWREEVGGGRKAWPKAIKERIFHLIDLGVRRKQIAERSGISYETINQWQYKRKQSQLIPAKPLKFHELAVSKENATVTVTESKILFKTPKGFEISGLNTLELKKLLLELGGLNAL